MRVTETDIRRLEAIDVRLNRDQSSTMDFRDLRWMMKKFNEILDEYLESELRLAAAWKEIVRLSRELRQRDTETVLGKLPSDVVERDRLE